MYVFKRLLLSWEAWIVIGCSVVRPQPYSFCSALFPAWSLLFFRHSETVAHEYSLFSLRRFSLVLALRSRTVIRAPSLGPTDPRNRRSCSFSSLHHFLMLSHLSLFPPSLSAFPAIAGTVTTMPLSWAFTSAPYSTSNRTKYTCPPFDAR